MHSPHPVRFPRTMFVRALILLLGVSAGFALLVPRVASSEDQATQDYVVTAGDTLTSVAAEFGTTVQELVELNALTDFNHIVIGSRLQVPAVTSSPEVSEVRYTVAPGDTLWGIANTFGIEVSELAERNGLDADAHVIAGTDLVVPVKVLPVEAPPDRKHEVAAGETLSGIAAVYGVTVGAIVDANPLIDPDMIRPGQVLTVPAQALPQLSPQTEAALLETSSEFGIDPYLLLALSLMESGWQSHVVSSTGAIGLMQLMPDTAAWTVDHLTPAATNWHVSVEDNARVGAAYLDHLLFLEGGDVEGALASYYQGWASYKVVGMFEETRAYVDDVLALTARLRASDLP